ncbi:MAG: lipid-A-disaccharide synthase [Bacteroidota bacterium]|nr:lipid-A-disaccharide synthase [Bacteroidota bacterium]
MKYYIIAGEASGDLHGSNLIKGLKKVDPEAEILAWGGEKMQQAGATLRMHYKHLAIMGFVEVLAHLGTIKRNFNFAKKDITKFNPDVLITIDFPGFNLRMTKWAHKTGFKTFHYISPNLWAWNKNRVHHIRKYVDKLFVILPFEPDFYKDFDMTVEYEGHPLLDAVNQFEPLPEAVFRNQFKLSEKPIVAILPGSRKQEISRMLPLMLKIATRHTNYEYLVAGAPSIDKDFYHKYTKKHPQIKVLHNNTYNILDKAVAGMITSGTATLEAALFNVPQVVCYKTNPVSFNIARMIVKIRRFSLVNLIMKKNVVTELIQHLMTPDALNREFESILPGHEKYDEVLKKYGKLRKKIGKKGVSTRIAQKMYKALQ